MTDTGETSKIIAGMAHGGHAIADDVRNAKQLSQEGFTLLSEAVQAPVGGGVRVRTTDFDYMFKKLVGDEQSHLPAGADTQRIVKALDALGNAMANQSSDATERTSTIPPIFTYWGQFVDHDMTAATDTDSPEELSIRPDVPAPVEPRDIRRMLVNARNPALNLDSVYGEGPFTPEPTDPDKVFVPYQPDDPAKLRLGLLDEQGGPIPPFDDKERDLPRKGGGDLTPLVGDRRNDENLIVAQLHVAFLKFHNATVDWVRANEPYRTGVIEVFRRARDLVRWHYQWLCVHDFLKTVALPDAVGRALSTEDENMLERLGRRQMPYVPLEYAVAAYRFGHSMVRASYDWNRNFGRPASEDTAFDLLFAFTGSGGMFGSNALPSTWPAEWERMVDPDSAFPNRFARPIDTNLAPPLGDLRNATGPVNVEKLLKQLARRNLRRGYRLNLPTGQAVAQQLGLQALSHTELQEGLAEVASRLVGDTAQQEAQDLAAGGFDTRTPLWYYVLREAEVRTQGNSLGPVGSTIVAETVVAHLRFDKTSYLHQSGQGRYGAWSPHDGVRLPDGGRVNSIRNFLRFAGVL